MANEEINSTVKQEGGKISIFAGVAAIVIIVIVIIAAAIFIVIPGANSPATGQVTSPDTNKPAFDFTKYCENKSDLNGLGIIAIASDENGGTASNVSIKGINAPFFLIVGKVSGKEVIQNTFLGQTGKAADLVKLLKENGATAIAFSAPSKDIIDAMHNAGVKCYKTVGVIANVLHEQVQAAPNYCKEADITELDLSKLTSAVAIASDANGMSGIISLAGARAPYFILYSAEKNAYAVLDNNLPKVSTIESDLAKLLKSRGVKTAILANPSQLFSSALKTEGIECYKTLGAMSKLKK
ncbi:Dinitrogenase iron-molybdenum cofactor [uncultured archaeon]|nr:Dinitrogenase iron-molybdenum cofactor [uncultured archaeon]